MTVSDLAKSLGIDENILRTLASFESSSSPHPTTDAARGIMVLPLEHVIPNAQRYGLVPFHGVPNMSAVSHGPYVKSEDYEELRTKFIELVGKVLDERK